MTPEQQEIFEIVSKHLTSMKKQSIAPGPDAYCLYRGPDSNKSAVGCLIPDDDYLPLFDTNRMSLHTLVDYLEDHNLKIKYITRVNQRLLDAMQQVHDDYMNWDAAGFNERGKSAIHRLEATWKLR